MVADEAFVELLPQPITIGRDVLNGQLASPHSARQRMQNVEQMRL